MRNTIDHITIVGMGALGILYGAFFGEKLGWESVTFLGDEERVKRFSRDGAVCNGKPCGFKMEEAGDGGPGLQLLIFAVKAAGLEAAVELARERVDQDTVILSVLNGISSEEIIEKNLGRGTVIPCVAQGMDAVKTGNALTYSHLGTLCIGIPDGQEEKRPALDRLAELFERTGLPHVVETDILRRLWCKWMLNVGVNQTVMVSEGNYRTVQQPGAAREMMKAAMAEVMTVAQAEGISVTEADLEEYVALVDSLNPDGMPSMRQDGLARRPSEVELFSGTVIRRAKQLELDVPVNRKLYQRIREMEREY